MVGRFRIIIEHGPADHAEVLHRRLVRAGDDN
jgi:hypothetical protein